MKKILTVLIGLLLILSNCTDENTDGNSDNNKKTMLTINNQSDVNIVNVNYASVDFGSISKGETSAKEVSQGTRYIYFSIKINNESIDCRTDVITCDEGQNTNFNMTNNTTIVETAGDTRTTIKNLYNTLSNDVTGTWGDADGEVTLVITNDTWAFVLGYSYFSGTWTRQGSILTLTRYGNIHFGNATLSGNDIQLYASFNDNERNNITYTWILKKGASFQKEAKLTIQNQSSFTLIYTKWSNETFVSLPPSFSDTINVNANTGYVYFTITNGIECRTQELLTVVNGDNKTFTITNNTIVIALNDASSTPKTLQEIASSEP